MRSGEVLKCGAVAVNEENAMKNKFTFLISLCLLCWIGLACQFKFGETSENSNTSENKIAEKNSKDKKSEKNTDDSGDTESESPKKAGNYFYQRFDYSLYKIPKNLSESELTKVAEKLHSQEPKSFLVLIDDDSKVKQYITYHEQLENGSPEVEFPTEWANEHIVASVIMFLEGGGKWYLTKGYSYEKIVEID